ncbi:MAG TPA: hypothetical protein VHN37_13785 [Actinomycetota bacterium]|nr:hypothetical protein [Actinomycetota bacterium]
MRYALMSLITALVLVPASWAHAGHCDDQFIRVEVDECPEPIAPAGEHACVGVGGPGTFAAWFCTPGP